MADISVLNTTAQLTSQTLVTEEGNWTITGTWTFDNDPSAPFAVSASSAVVSNLDADKLDGQEGTYYRDADNLNAGTVPTARLGSGTADTTTYLRGDSSWQTIGTTKTILLPVSGAELDATNPPEAIIAANRMHLAFQDTTDELIYYQFRLPTGYSSSPVVKFQYAMATATSGTCIWGCDVWALTPDSDAVDIDTESYDTANTQSDTVPGTAGHPAEVSLTLSNVDSMAAGDLVTLRIYRDASADSASGDAELHAISLEYSE